MGHFSNLVLMLFVLTIVLHFGTGLCGSEYGNYVNETYDDNFGIKSPIDYMLNQIVDNWAVALGLIGGVITIALIGSTPWTLVIGVLMLQVLVNTFILPIDCLHTLGLPEPLGTILILFINLLVLIMAVSFIMGRDV